MILVIDNYDSFTYNLVQALGHLSKGNIAVHRNDKITSDEIRKLKPSHIVISPGPCTPNEAGISMEVIKEFAGEIPLLGVCLGHQAIAQVFGGDVVQTGKPVHGKSSIVDHDSKTVFKNIPSPMEVMRYHSLVVAEESLPEDLEVSSKFGEYIMGIRSKIHPCLEGVQFHPESFRTPHGKLLLQNFLDMQIH